MMNFRSRLQATLMAVTTLLLLLAGVVAWADSNAVAQPDVLALGKLVYEEKAGGVGCAYCHGLLGTGKGTAGVDAPNIIGVQEAALRSSLAGAVPLMGFISLTEEEIQAVLAYLQALAQPPAAQQ